MAVLDTTSGAAEIAQTLGITDFPFTMAAWVRRTGSHSGSAGAIAMLGNAGNNYHGGMVTGLDYPSAQSRYNSGTTQVTVRPTALTENAWRAVVFRFTASDTRDVFLSTIGGTTNGTGDAGGYSSGSQVINKFIVGAYALTTNRFKGQISHIAVWNTALINAEVEAFLDGGNPLAIANDPVSSNLMGYWAEDFYQDTDWYYEDKSGNNRHLLLQAGAVRDTTTIGPTVAAPPSTVELGITITGIKEPNIANEMVDGVSNARVKVWAGTDDTGAENEVFTGLSITGGALSVSTDTLLAIDSTATVEVMWTVGTERKLFITETTVVDLGSGS